MLFKTINRRHQNLSIVRRNMAGKESISVVMVMLLFCLLPYTGASDENFIVPEFGVGFEFVWSRFEVHFGIHLGSAWGPFGVHVEIWQGFEHKPPSGPDFLTLWTDLGASLGRQMEPNTFAKTLKFRIFKSMPKMIEAELDFDQTAIDLGLGFRCFLNAFHVACLLLKDC